MRKYTYLAFDLGAESGRALIGRFEGGVLSVEEIHRFANEPVRYNGELHWDVARLWCEMQRAIRTVATSNAAMLDGIGLDTWGVDYALLGEGGALLENPYHYRDSRTEGIPERVFSIVPRDEVFARTGIQIMPINTLYQIYAAHLKTPRLLELSQYVINMPDLFNFWLTGVVVSEFTIATTTQYYDPRQGRWSTELFAKLGLPTHLFAPVVQPGAVIGSLHPGVAKEAGISECPVIAPACHDTGSAFAAAGGPSAFISSGTWSLLGTEVEAPVINPEAQHLNFTNEGGVCGTFRLLKNITGLWLLQRCRRDWQLKGQEHSYAELCDLARSTPAFRSLIDPDDESFVRPEAMTEAIDRFCAMTGQPLPQDPPTYTRTVLESLALKYRVTLDRLERLTGLSYDEIHIVGGGARNVLLNQFTAEATGRRVVAGPVEATALGNLGMQMLATGAATSLSEVRKVIAQSYPVQVFEPVEADKWQETVTRFEQICGMSSRQS
jgi:rhamnulokinase